MKYFDLDLIKKFFNTGQELRVSDGKRFVSVVDFSDVFPTYLIGISASGQSYKIPYKGIEIVKLGNELYTLEMLRAGDTANSTDELPDKVTIDDLSEGKINLLKKLNLWGGKS